MKSIGEIWWFLLKKIFNSEKGAKISHRSNKTIFPVWVISCLYEIKLLPAYISKYWLKTPSSKVMLKEGWIGMYTNISVMWMRSEVLKSFKTFITFWPFIVWIFFVESIPSFNPSLPIFDLFRWSRSSSERCCSLVLLDNRRLEGSSTEEWPFTLFEEPTNFSCLKNKFWWSRLS